MVPIRLTAGEETPGGVERWLWRWQYLFALAMAPLAALFTVSPSSLEAVQEHYWETKISPRYGERWFCSEAEARAAGWKARR